MLTLNKQSDYGLIILQKLAKEKQLVPLSRLVKETKLPPRFLARIAAILVKKKILISREGRVGGYLFSAKINDFSLYDYFSIFEKNLTFLKCLVTKKKCKYDSVCCHKSNIKTKLNDIVLNQLKTITLLEVLE